VGQLVAETIRLYGERFFGALPLGLPIAVLDAVAFDRTLQAQTVLLWAFAPAVTASYVWASARVCGVATTAQTIAVAFAIGLLVFLPFPVLYRIFILPGLALFALVGLSVPAAVCEGLGFRAALRRGLELGRVDFVHALGGLATLVLVYALSRYALLFLLRTQSDQTQRVAGFLADLVLAPLLFLGSALLYVDQAARAAVRRDRRLASSVP
jgi:hypothetical protein